MEDLGGKLNLSNQDAEIEDNQSISQNTNSIMKITKGLDKLRYSDNELT